MARAGKILTIIGVVFSVLALILFIIGLVSSSSGGPNPEDYSIAKGSDTFTVHLEEGQTYQLWSGSSFTDVTVTGPYGNSVDLYPRGTTNDDWELIGEFTATIKGEYTFAVSPTLDEVIVTQDIYDSSAGYTYGAGVTGMMCSFCIGPVGIILLIVGIILLVVKKEKKKQEFTSSALKNEFSRVDTYSSSASTGMEGSPHGTVIHGPPSHGNETRTCLSCGRFVDPNRTTCPFCNKPVSGTTMRDTSPEATRVIIQNIGHYIAGDSISIRDSVVQRSTIGSTAIHDPASVSRESTVVPGNIEWEDKESALNIYREVLKQVYSDGKIDENEYKILKIMREKDNITIEDHMRIEAEVLSEYPIHY